MVIRKRTAKIIEETPKSEEVEPLKPFDFSTWKEQACYVLNILESRGINIYDTTRKPGMYLKNHKKTIPENLLDKISETVKPQMISDSPQIPQNLINFFTKQ